MKDYTPLIAPIVAFLTGRIACRLIRKFALAIGFVDSPDRRRKLQELPIPLGGGIVVWLAVCIAWMSSLTGRSSDHLLTVSSLGFVVALAIASAWMLIVGLVDDRYVIRGIHKLAGQLVSAVFLVMIGVRIDVVSAFGFEVPLGLLAYPVTVFWIVLVVNAFNLIDGMDGFCGGIGLVVSLVIAWLAYASGRVEDTFIALAIAGGLTAFLKDNLPPAKIYLGDAGSMTVGLFISVLSIRSCSGGSAGAVSVPLLVALMALPLLDVLTALCRRWLTGNSLFMPDRGHIQHCLRSRLRSTSVALGVGVGLTAFAACSVAVAKTWQIGDGVAVLAVVTTVILLAGTNLFGGSELRLLLYRVRTIVWRFLAHSSSRRGIVRQECHMIGVRNWSRVWDDLIRGVEDAGGRRIELAIDLPSAGETYHGTCTLPSDSESRSSWSIVHSLQVGNLHAGTLWIAGDVHASQGQYLDKVEKLVRDLQDQLEEELRRDLNSQVEFAASPPSQYPTTQLPAHGLAGLAVQNSEA